MKIACNRCLTVRDEEKLRDWMRLRTDYTTYWLCEECAVKFWALLDGGGKEPAPIREDLTDTAIQRIMMMQRELDAAVMEIRDSIECGGCAHCDVPAEKPPCNECVGTSSRNMHDCWQWRHDYWQWRGVPERDGE